MPPRATCARRRRDAAAPLPCRASIAPNFLPTRVMHLADVRALIAQAPDDEWVDLELKRTTGEKWAAMHTLCAFLNTRGGTVIFGAHPTAGRLLGQDVSDATIREVTELFGRFEPGAAVDMHRVPLDDGSGKELLVLAVTPVEEEQPYVFDGTPYRRDGSTTRLMPQNVYRQLLARREHVRLRWENRPAAGVRVDDLDAGTVREFIRLGTTSGRLPAEDSDDLAQVLRKRHLARDDGRVLNAAVVLFGRPNPGDFAQCRMHLARFEGTTKDADMADQEPPVYGNAFALLRAAERFLSANLPRAGRTLPGVFERADDLLFPWLALREVLVNALCHRDYSRPTGSIHVAVYTDRVEVTNAGTLPQDLSLEDLKREHDSFPRNPLIATVFYDCKLAEAWGRGTRRIVRLCTGAGHPEPEYFEQGGSFGVRLLPKGGSIVPQAAPPKLTARQQAILRLLVGAPRGVSTIRDGLIDPPGLETVRDDLQRLRALDLARSEGRGRGATWGLTAGGLELAQALADAVRDTTG